MSRLNYLGLRSGFPFPIRELAEDGKPFEQWDGSTAAKPADYCSKEPSKSSAQFVDVFGEGSFRPYGFTLSEITELFWRARRWKFSLDPSTTVSISAESVTTQGGHYVYASGGWRWVEASVTADSVALSTLDSFEGQIVEVESGWIFDDAGEFIPDPMGEVRLVQGSSPAMCFDSSGKPSGVFVDVAGATVASFSASGRKFHSVSWGTNGVPARAETIASAELATPGQYFAVGVPFPFIFDLIFAEGKYWPRVPALEGNATTQRTGQWLTQSNNPPYGDGGGVYEYNSAFFWTGRRMFYGELDEPQDPQDPIFTGKSVTIQIKAGGKIHNFPVPLYTFENNPDGTKCDQTLIPGGIVLAAEVTQYWPYDGLWDKDSGAWNG